LSLTGKIIVLDQLCSAHLSEFPGIRSRDPCLITFMRFPARRSAPCPPERAKRAKAATVLILIQAPSWTYPEVGRHDVE
jgi:hypothetical protein